MRKRFSTSAPIAPRRDLMVQAMGRLVEKGSPLEIDIGPREPREEARPAGWSEHRSGCVRNSDGARG